MPDRPAPTRGTFARRRAGVGAVLALVLAALVYVPATLLAPLDAAEATLADYAAPTLAQTDVVWPDHGSGAVTVLGRDDVRSTHGDAAAQVPIASITKVVTALTVLAAHPLADGDDGPTITFDADDVALFDQYRAVNGKVLAMPDGLQLSQRQTLEVVLIESANNYATSLARWAFGDDAAFVAAANEWLASNGLAGGITILEPTGLDAGNTGSPDALLRLGELALADPVVAAIVGTASTTVPGAGLLENTNEVLAEQGGAGIKTGNLDTWGWNLLFAQRIAVGDETVTVVGVQLGSPTDDALFSDVRATLTSVAAGFQAVRLATEGQVVGSVTSEWGETVDVVATRDIDAVLYQGDAITGAASSQPVVSGDRGDVVGELALVVDGAEVAVPLALDGDLTPPDAWWRLTHPAEAFS